MRWQLVDRIEEWSAWSRIRAQKTVSFEEYTLQEPFGLEGSLPETLALEGLVQSVGWLVMASSGFAMACRLSGVPEVTFEGPAFKGDVLKLEASVAYRAGDLVSATVRATGLQGPVCTGSLEMALLPLAGLMDASEARAAFAELCHGT